MPKTPSEYITTIDGLEVWGNKYTFKSWRTPVPLYNIATDEEYEAGDLCFALISYIDNDGNYHFVDETKYFMENFL